MLEACSPQLLGSRRRPKRRSPSGGRSRLNPLPAAQTAINYQSPSQAAPFMYAYVARRRQFQTGALQDTFLPAAFRLLLPSLLPLSRDSSLKSTFRVTVTFGRWWFERYISQSHNSRQQSQNSQHLQSSGSMPWACRGGVVGVLAMFAGLFVVRGVVVGEDVKSCLRRGWVLNYSREWRSREWRGGELPSVRVATRLWSSSRSMGEHG